MSAWVADENGRMLRVQVSGANVAEGESIPVTLTGRKPA